MGGHTHSFIAKRKKYFSGKSICPQGSARHIKRIEGSTFFHSDHTRLLHPIITYLARHLRLVGKGRRPGTHGRGVVAGPYGLLHLAPRPEGEI